MKGKNTSFIIHVFVFITSQEYLLAVLAAGEGRVFQSPNYPSNYPNLQACTYNFEPAAGAQLRFSCSDFDLTATSAAGALCTGDYLRYRRPPELSTNLREVSVPVEGIK